MKTWLWDSNAAFTKVLDDPTAYGFVDNTSYGDNTNDFWGNNYHPSSASIYSSRYFCVLIVSSLASAGAAQTIWGQGVAAVLNDTIW